jgi:hypothetical protein
VPEEHWDNPEGQANLAVAEIERLQNVEKAHKAAQSAMIQT